jgi:hypothetical protein
VKALDGVLAYVVHVLWCRGVLEMAMHLVRDVAPLSRRSVRLIAV